MLFLSARRVKRPPPRLPGSAIHFASHAACRSSGGDRGRDEEMPQVDAFDLIRQAQQDQGRYEPFPEQRVRVVRACAGRLAGSGPSRV